MRKDQCTFFIVSWTFSVFFPESFKKCQGMVDRKKPFLLSNVIECSFLYLTDTKITIKY